MWPQAARGNLLTMTINERLGRELHRAPVGIAGRIHQLLKIYIVQMSMIQFFFAYGQARGLDSSLHSNSQVRRRFFVKKKSPMNHGPPFRTAHWCQSENYVKNFFYSRSETKTHKSRIQQRPSADIIHKFSITWWPSAGQYPAETAAQIAMDTGVFWGVAALCFFWWRM